MNWIVLLYWIERDQPWTPNDHPDEHRLVTADTEEEALGLAVERFGYEDEEGDDAYPAYLAIPVRGRPERMNVQVTRTVERVPV